MIGGVMEGMQGRLGERGKTRSYGLMSRVSDCGFHLRALESA